MKHGTWKSSASVLESEKIKHCPFHEFMSRAAATLSSVLKAQNIVMAKRTHTNTANWASDSEPFLHVVSRRFLTFANEFDASNATQSDSFQLGYLSVK